MPRSRIPERNPIGDPFSGSLVRVAQEHAIMPQIDPDALISGEFVVRYGVRFLGKQHLSIVPGILALDYGEMLTGEEAWEFIYHKSNLYPRADVVGYRHDGEDEMIALKHLDVAITPDVLLYEDATATKPIARVTALIASAEEAASLPPRITQYLPRFESVTEWKSNG